MPRRPIDQLQAGRAYYARHLPSVDQDHFGVLWHLFTVGHLVTIDLDALARQSGYSFADLDLLGTLGVDESAGMRATDLASALYVSNAVVSKRVARLERDRLITRRKDAADGRGYFLALTEQGRRLTEAAIARLAHEAKIVRFFRKLEPQDQRSLVRILGDLHERFDREFVGGTYWDS